jgi:hypothetical protein
VGIGAYRPNGALRLSPTGPVKEPKSKERGVERHCSRSTSSCNGVLKEGEGGQSTLCSVFSLLPLPLANMNCSMHKISTPTSTTTLTSSPSSSRRGDGDGGGGGWRGGTEELPWTMALSKAINWKRRGRRTHFGGSRPLALTRDGRRWAPLDVCLLLLLLTRTRHEKLKQRKWSKAMDGGRIRLRRSPPFSGTVVDISLDMTTVVLMTRLMNTYSTGGVSHPCTAYYISPLRRLPSFLGSFGMALLLCYGGSEMAWR